jgi:hypothetical protein
MRATNCYAMQKLSAWNPGILLSTVLGKSYLAHLEQWLAEWLRVERICIVESMQIPGILLTTVLGKSYLAHLEQ